MTRFCEMFADEDGRLRVVFREVNGPRWETYGHYQSPLPIPAAVETAYAVCGPFGERSGSIDRIRVVSVQ